MQGYLKLKEKDEELYEISVAMEPSNNWIKKCISLLIYSYLGLVVKIKKWFHIITVKEIYSGLIFILPIFSSDKKLQNQLRKCIPKVKKLMKKYQISQIVLAEKLQQNEIFMQEFQNNREVERKVHILDEKEMMFYLIKEIIEYISQKQGKTIQLEDLYLLVKQDSNQQQANILFLAQNFKNINIITPSLKSYQKLAKQLEEKYDIIVTVTNNKRKSLKRAKWVINFDLSAEEIKKYTINRTAIIVYLTKEGVYEENSFEGLHICKAEIDISQDIKTFFEQQNLLSQYPITVLYESILEDKKSFNKVREQIKKDNVKIEKLWGRRGILTDKEYSTMAKNY